MLWDALKLGQEVFAGQRQPSGELSALQRAAQAAAEPLIALGQSVASTAFGYLGSSTAVAITSGLGVLRLGLGEIRGPPAQAHLTRNLDILRCRVHFA